MKHAMKLTLLAVAAAALQAPVAAAQSITRPFSFGVAGGLSVPSRDGSDGLESGYHVEGRIGFKPPVLPIGLRADVVYHRFGFDGFDGGLNMVGGVLNATYDVIPTPLITPYLMAGVGMYRLEASVAGEEEAVTRVGLNGGAGLRFGLAGISTFVETRYQFIQDGVDVVPISFGVMF